MRTHDPLFAAKEPFLAGKAGNNAPYVRDAGRSPHFAQITDLQSGAANLHEAAGPAAPHKEVNIPVDLPFIQLLERDEVQMDKLTELVSLEQTSVHELKKNMPNMEVFLENVAEILASCAGADPVAVLRFDIARFKQVNDDFGFDVGDRVILACYEIILESARPFGGDACVGRTHGDEFVLFVKGDGNQAAELASRIVEGLGQFPFSSVGCHSKVACTIGLLHTVKEKTGDIRRIIEDTLETVNEARKGGPNTVLQLPYMEG
jgi:diguanylate cyclase (GGDEF)-like protein